MSDFISRLKSGLAKTKASLVENINTVVSKARGLNEDVLAQMEELLILSDMGVETSELIIEKLRDRCTKSAVNDQQSIIRILKEEMELLFVDHKAAPFQTKGQKPFVISIVGVNGTGKTTTIGKLARKLKTDGHQVLLAAADTFRAAAIDQLGVWGERSGIEVIKPSTGADPAAVAFDALKAAQARKSDVLIIDTAGRLHTKVNLMAELDKIHRVLTRLVPGAPHEVLLVLDATTGQNGLAQAKMFAKSVHLTGIVLTKLDGTAKGGIVFSIMKELNIPVRYIGLGEKIDDLEEFDPKTFIEALFQ